VLEQGIKPGTVRWTPCEPGRPGLSTILDRHGNFREYKGRPEPLAGDVRNERFSIRGMSCRSVGRKVGSSQAAALDVFWGERPKCFRQTKKLKQFLPWLIAFLPFGAWASSTIETPAFTLKLTGDWIPGRRSDPEQQTFYSKQLDVGLTISFTLMNAKPSDTERIASKLKEFRLAGENNAAKTYNLKMTIADPIVVPFSKGHQVAYYGHDNTNRQFQYLGLVLPSKVVKCLRRLQNKKSKRARGNLQRASEGIGFVIHRSDAIDSQRLRRARSASRGDIPKLAKPRARMKRTPPYAEDQ
jgi:hypothetical protein